MSDERNGGGGANERLEARINELLQPVTPASTENATEAGQTAHMSPEWREFYHAVRMAVLNMRSEGKDNGGE